MLPEFDRFGLFTHEEALGRVGKAMARRLAGISLRRYATLRNEPAVVLKRRILARRRP